MLNLKFKRVIASTLCASCVLALASCSLVKDKVSTADLENLQNGDIVLTIADEPVDYEEYRYFYLNSKNDLSGGDDNYFSENPDEATTLKENTLKSIAQYHSITSLASELGVEVTDEDKATTEETIQSYIDYYTEETFNEMLEESYLSLDLFKELNDTITLESRLYDALVEDGTRFATDDESIKEKLMGDDYVRVMHILYADKETAEGVLEEAKNASDDEFYELAQSAEDGGMIGNTAGYCFTEGEMVAPFEEASFALEVGETSGLVESDYGYHIIRRLEKSEDYIDDNFESLKPSYLQSCYYNYIDENADAIMEGIKFEPIFDLLDVDTVK